MYFKVDLTTFFWKEKESSFNADNLNRYLNLSRATITYVREYFPQFLDYEVVRVNEKSWKKTRALFCISGNQITYDEDCSATGS